MTPEPRRTGSPLESGDAMQKAAEVLDAQFSTSVNYGPISKAMPEAIRAFLSAQDRETLREVVLGALNAHSFIHDGEPAEVAAQLAVDALLDGLS